MKLSARIRYSLSASVLGRIFFILAAVIITTGCAINRASGSIEPGTDLAAKKTMCVKKYAEDNRGVNLLIAEKLKTKGVAASACAEEKPGHVDAVVTYKDKWFWDITMYMLELDIVIRETDSNLPIAKGNSYHTSLTRLSPQEMVSEVINNIYKGIGK